MQIFSPLHPRRLIRLKQYITGLSGLVAYWPLWEGDGAVAVNHAPDNLRTLNGTITGATLGQAGKVGRAYSFDGVSDFLTLPVTIPTTTLSVGFIYRRTGTEDASDRVLNWTDGGPSGGFDISHQGVDPDKVQIIIRNGGTSTADISTNALTLNEWYFIVFTYQVNEFKFFSNGSQLGVTDTSVTMSTPTQTLTAMRRSDSSTNFTKGDMQHLFVVDGVLTAEQIKKMAQKAGLA